MTRRLTALLEQHGPLVVPLSAARWVREVEEQATALQDQLHRAAGGAPTRIVRAAIDEIDAFALGPTATVAQLARTRAGLRRMAAGIPTWLGARWLHVRARGVTALEQAGQVATLRQAVERLQGAAARVTPIGERLLGAARLDGSALDAVASGMGLRAMERRLGRAMATLETLGAYADSDDCGTMDDTGPLAIPAVLWRALAALEHPGLRRSRRKVLASIPRALDLLQVDLETIGGWDAPPGRADDGLSDVLAHWQSLPPGSRGLSDFGGLRARDRSLLKHLLSRSAVLPHGAKRHASPSATRAAPAAGPGPADTGWYLHPIRAQWALGPGAAGDRLVFLLRDIPSAARVWEMALEVSATHRVVAWSPLDRGGLVAEEWAALFGGPVPPPGWHEQLERRAGRVEVLGHWDDVAVARVLQAPVIRHARQIPGPDDPSTLLVVHRARRHDRQVRPIAELPREAVGQDMLVPVSPLGGGQARFLFHPWRHPNDRELISIHHRVGPVGAGLAVLGTATLHDNGLQEPGTLFAWPHAWLPFLASTPPPWFERLRRVQPLELLASVAALMKRLASRGVWLGVVHEAMLAFLPQPANGVGQPRVRSRLVLMPVLAKPEHADLRGLRLDLSRVTDYEGLGYARPVPRKFREDPSLWARAAFALYACDLLWTASGRSRAGCRGWAQVEACARELIEAGLGHYGDDEWGDMRVLLGEQSASPGRWGTPDEGEATGRAGEE